MALGTAQQMYLDGEWQPSLSGETFEAVSPATGELIATCPRATRGRPRGDRAPPAPRPRLGASDGVRARGQDDASAT